MPYETLNLGIQLTLPTAGTQNWAQALKNTTWTKISQHRHTGGGDGAQIVGASIAANAVSGDKLAKNLAFAQAATLTPSGNTETIDFDNGNIQTLDLGAASGNVAVTLANPIAGASYKIWIIQAASPLDIVWPVSVKWPQGQSPILTQDDNAIDLVELYYNGSVFLGQWQNDWR
jgi:hypothetical protein